MYDRFQVQKTHSATTGFSEEWIFCCELGLKMKRILLQYGCSITCQRTFMLNICLQRSHWILCYGIKSALTTPHQAPPWTMGSETPRGPSGRGVRLLADWGDGEWDATSTGDSGRFEGFFKPDSAPSGDVGECDATLTRGDGECHLAPTGVTRSLTLRCLGRRAASLCVDWGDEECHTGATGFAIDAVYVVCS